MPKQFYAWQALHKTKYLFKSSLQSQKKKRVTVIDQNKIWTRDLE